MGGKFKGKLDKESRTAMVEGSGLQLEDLEDMIRWLTSVKYWMSRAKANDNGGMRWVFRLGTDPEAHYMMGLVRRHRVPLVRVKPRKMAECGACRGAIESGAAAWKQKPKSWGGHSRNRFCDRCVQRGGAWTPPKLELIQGGAVEEP